MPRKGVFRQPGGQKNTTVPKGAEHSGVAVITAAGTGGRSQTKRSGSQKQVTGSSAAIVTIWCYNRPSLSAAFATPQDLLAVLKQEWVPEVYRDDGLYFTYGFQDRRPGSIVRFQPTRLADAPYHRVLAQVVEHLWENTGNNFVISGEAVATGVRSKFWLKIEGCRGFQPIAPAPVTPANEAGTTAPAGQQGGSAS